ncbi:type II secretion system protein J [Prochlorococcus marinus]|jgi:hypothetical protein|uniref:Uncharacterized protein n=1 Tax=Prochlorococcus marinus (strain MIT 9301) TaxID=167546 RepID=A3PC45_PROM0|nr:hypothetical protein [Prochlorococcus marinus]ABO17320.1 Conserved hypothetical protein [Prochlorococcus marinus str. MIT 9301]
MMNIKMPQKDGFSIIELIIAGAISVTAIGVGFSLLQIALKGNKIDETQMGLNGRINDTLDFILDEVKASKRIIDNETEILQFNQNCTFPDDSQFLFGINLPDQALVRSDYDPKGGQFNLNQVECPIVYSLRASSNNEKKPFSLIRYGPQYNESGYYISPSYIQFQETTLLDGITDSTNYKKISCPNKWGDIKTVKGISFCIDEFKKAIEIQIEASDLQKGIDKNEIRSIASIGGFTSIQDENQINIYQNEPNNEQLSSFCFGSQCCWMGICLKSNKVTYIIDNSFFMNEDYLHLNGQVIDGSWEQIDEPELISPTINGKNLFEYTINSLKQHINKLPSSNNLSEENKIYIQIISNNGSSNYLFEDGPQALTSENKIAAFSFLNNLTAEVETAINPWEDVCRSLESEYIGQLIILSAWKPSTIKASILQPCVGREDGNFEEIIDDYNQLTRSKSAIGALVIDSISLYNNFCESSKNIFANDWLGSLSKGPESFCVHIK